MNLKPPLITFILTACFSGNVLAQYTGPTTGQMHHLKEILEDSKDEQQVRIKGYLIEKTGDETYLFESDNHVISVEIEQEDFPRQEFNETHLIEITGEVDRDKGEQPEIEVDSITIVK